MKKILLVITILFALIAVNIPFSTVYAEEEKQDVQAEETYNTESTVTTSDGIVFDTYTGTITDYVGSASTLNIPSSISGVSVNSIGFFAFMNASSLRTINLPQTISNIELCAFNVCDNLQAINVDNNNNNFTSIDGVIYTSNMSKIIRYPSGKYGDRFTVPSSVAYIGDNTFDSCKYLKEVHMSNGVQTIGDAVFALSSRLTKVTIPSSVTSIGGYAFNGHSSQLKIYGSSGSYAQTYAVANNIPFSTSTIKRTVSFNLNGGTSVQPSTQYIDNGGFAKKPENPTRNGYKFKGWYDNKDLKGIPIFSFASSKSIKPIYSNSVLYAKWEENPLDNRIRYEEDVFAWNNIEQNFPDNYKICGDYRNVLFDNLGPVESAKARIQLLFNWNGSCYGMSTVMALTKIRELDPWFFQYVEDKDKEEVVISDFQKPIDSTKINNLITYYLFSQFSFDMTRKNNNFESLADFIKKIENVKTGGMPVILSFTESGEWLNHGHTVIAYDVFTTFKGDEKIFNIKIWDPNVGSSSYGCIILKIPEKGFKPNMGFEIYLPSGDVCYEVKKLRGYISEKEDIWNNIQDILESRGVKGEYGTDFYNIESEDEKYFYLTTNYRKYIIVNADGLTATVDGFETTGDLQILDCYPSNEIGQSPEYVYVFEDLSDYTITQIEDEGLEEYRTMFYYTDETNGFLNHITSESPGQITFNADGTFSTDFEQDTLHTVSSTRNDSETPWYTTEVTATESGLAVENTQGQVEVLAEDNNLDGAQITASNDYNDVKVTLDTNEGSASTLYSEGDDELIVMDVTGTQEIASADMLYSVNFNTYGGSIVEAQVNIASGSLVDEPDTPTLSGCLFGGWYKDADCTDGMEWNFGVDTITEDVALHAKWDIDENATHILTFMSGVQDDILVLVEHGSDLESTPEVPKKPWYDGTWEQTDYTNIVEDKSINAVYVPKSTDFDDNGETDLSDVAGAAQYYNQQNEDYDLNEDGTVNLFDLIGIAKEIN